MHYPYIIAITLRHSHIPMIYPEQEPYALAIALTLDIALHIDIPLDI